MNTPRLEPHIEQRIRQLSPVNELPHQYQNIVMRSGEVLTRPRGAVLFSAGTRDDFVHYLLAGRLSITTGGGRRRLLDAGDAEALQPLEEHGRPRSATATVVDEVTVFRLRGSILKHEVDLAETAPPPPPQVMDLDEEDPEDWIVVTLRAGLFANLPVETIQHVLACATEVPVRAGQVIVRQDEPADYFYLIKSGAAEVERRPAPSAPAVHLAGLRAGDCIGEEALISDRTRNATVTMTEDGALLRLERADFERLIRDPLLQRLTRSEAERAVAGGARWLDARSAEAFERGALPGAVSVPLPLLRLKCRDLDADASYIVYSDDPPLSAVAAFLLSARGLDARYVDDVVVPTVAAPAPVAPLEASIRPLPEVQGVADAAESAPSDDAPGPAEGSPLPGDEAAAPAAPAAYADTVSGQNLASLVAEIQRDAAAVSAPAARDLADTTLGSGVQLDDELFAVEAGAAADDETPGAGTAAQREAALPEPLRRAIGELETLFAAQLEAAREQERGRIDAEVERRTALIRRRAEQVVRDKIKAARARDRARMAEFEQRVRARYARLAELANRITHQKAEIQRRRRQIEEKLNAAGTLHRELAELGQTMSRELDGLDDLMPEVQKLQQSS